MRKLFSTLLLLATCHAAFSQVKKYSAKDYAQKPYWIDMIKDTAANYFEVEKAFVVYFEHHELPEEEHDIIGERSVAEKKLSKKELRKRQAEDNMRMEVRKYEFWRFQMLPYVREDGTILTPSQRLQMWKQENSKK